MSTPGEERLQRGYRVLRRVLGGTEAPWAGVMVSTPSDGSGVLVGVETLPDNWRGWDAAASGHVLAPVDVVRRVDGHDVLLPVCPERVLDLLARRVSSHAPLSVGEGVTIAVSLVRGAAELETRGSRGESSPAPVGAWWLTEDGRPVFATDTLHASDMPLREATIDLLTAIAEAVPALEPSLSDATEALGSDSITREIERIETSLFAVASPEPLATSIFGPASARTIARAIEIRTPQEVAAPREGWLRALIRHVDVDWADVLSRATTSLGRTLRKRRAGRRRPLLIAMGAAGVVLVGGLVWPSGDGDSATAGTALGTPPPVSPPPTTITDGVAAEVAAEAGATPGGPPDLAAVTMELLSQRSDCLNDSACLNLVVESPGSAFPAGVIDLPVEERTATQVEELGGLAVFRVDAADAAVPSQLVVIIRQNERWLLRDVYDATQ